MNTSIPAIEQSGRKLKDHRQGKQSYSLHSAEDRRPQKSISEFLSTSKQRARSSKTQDLLGSPSNKRLKLDHPTSGSDRIKLSSQAVTPEDMYSLPSAKTGKNDVVHIPAKPIEVIDISDSPPGSPHEFSPFQRTAVQSSNSATYTGPKRLVVKNLKKVPRADPQQYFTQVWDQLNTALSAIFKNNNSTYSREELYRGVETLCRLDWASALFDKLCEKCGQEILTLLKEPLAIAASTGEDADILRAVIEAWSAWNSQLTTIRSIFFYMDRSYLLHSASLPSIEAMGVGEFRSHIFSNSTLKPRILQGACNLINDTRQGLQNRENDNMLLKSIAMFHTLAVYTTDFEPKFLSDSQYFFLSWAKEKIFAKSLAEYINESGDLISHEFQMCNIFGLDSSTKGSLETYIDDILIEHQQERLLNLEDVSELMERNAVDLLKRLFSLLQRRRLGEKLKVPFEAFIVKQGSKIIFDEKREHEMVIRLLDFKKKLNYFWEYAFGMHEGLGHTLREAFENFINMTKRSSMTWGTDNPKPGEMIAKYVDMILKGGAKAIPINISPEAKSKRTLAIDLDSPSEDEDSEITKQLDQVLDLFRFVHGKAVFEAFYKRDLARRLLLGRSASADAEKSMLTRLKSECGAGFTHNLEQMFRDIELAREEITSYKSMLEESKSQNSVDFNVNVLSASAWPTYPDIALEVPQNIQKAAAGFESYYKLKHSGRRLQWKHALAHCQLKAKFPKGNKEIVVSSFQAIILLLFSETSSETISYAEIQGASNLNDGDLKRTLQSLACAKYQVLAKIPKGKEISSSDSFAVNLNFSDSKYRIKINQIQAKETKEENKETHERVAADRNYEAQAAIVRIMKTRKTITHAELVSEVIVATKSRGVLDPADIKKNIEKLIEKDYMERQDNDQGRNIYSYLA